LGYLFRKGNTVKKKLFLLTALFLIAACTTAQPAPTSTPLPPTDTSIPPTQVSQPIEVTFDGKRCIVTGPTELPVGEHQFVFRDLVENNADSFHADLYVQNYSDGKTLQDYLDYQGEPGKYFKDPPWAIRVVKRGIEWNESIEGKIYTFLLNEAGEHVIVMLENSPLGVWICAPFWVIEAPSD
jgi:hypothetical protein